MVDTSHEDLRSGGHRADEIHVRHRERKSLGPWLGLLALGLGLLALWGYGRSRAHVAAATCAEATVHFATDTTALSADDKIAIRQLADCLRANPSQTVRLEGRAAPSELQTNEALAHARAQTLALELSALGVPPAQYSVTVGAPACTDGTEACLEQSRTAAAIPERH